MSRNKNVVKIYTNEEEQLIKHMIDNGDPFVLILYKIGGPIKVLQRYLSVNEYKCKKTIWTDKSFKELMAFVNPEIEILGTYQGTNKTIHCKCKIDGYEWDPFAGNLLRGYKCPVCGNQIVVTGINDIWTTNPELGKMLVNPDDGYKYCEHSNVKLEMHCPNCGAKKMISPNDVLCGGFVCDVCSDGIAYPEKFMRNLLDQINIDYEYQYCPEWIKPRKFDFYINKYNIIIETNGLQHYKDGFVSLHNTKNAVQQQINDNEKAKLALLNGIDKVIFVDCSFSRLDFMKNSILNNKELNEYFDFSNVDWIDIETKSHKSIVFDVCEYYNNMDDVIDKSMSKICNYISKEFNLCADTIKKYLEIGSDIHICNFVENQTTQSKRTNNRRVYEIDKNNNVINKWPSVKSIIDYYNNYCIITPLKKELFKDHFYDGHYWFYEEDYKSII